MTLLAKILLGGVLLVAGGVLMVVCYRLSQRWLPAGSPENLRPSLRLPFNEVLQGVLVTFAVLFLALMCLRGTARLMVGVIAAYVSTVLSSVGGFARAQAALQELGLPKNEVRMRWLLGVFFAGMAMFLSGLLTAGIVVYQQFHGVSA